MIPCPIKKMHLWVLPVFHRRSFAPSWCQSKGNMRSLRVDRTQLQLFTLRSLCCAVSLSLRVILQKCNSCLVSNFALTRQMERCLCKRNVTAGLGLYVLRFLWRNDNFYDVKTNVRSWHLKVRSHDLCMCYALAYVHRPGQPVNLSMHINFPFRLPSSFLQDLVSKTNSGRQTVYARDNTACSNGSGTSETTPNDY